MSYPKDAYLVHPYDYYLSKTSVHRTPELKVHGPSRYSFPYSISIWSYATFDEPNLGKPSNCTITKLSRTSFIVTTPSMPKGSDSNVIISPSLISCVVMVEGCSTCRVVICSVMVNAIESLVVLLHPAKNKIANKRNKVHIFFFAEFPIATSPIIKSVHHVAQTGKAQQILILRFSIPESPQ